MLVSPPVSCRGPSLAHAPTVKPPQCQLLRAMLGRTRTAPSSAAVPQIPGCLPHVTLSRPWAPCRLCSTAAPAVPHAAASGHQLQLARDGKPRSQAPALALDSSPRAHCSIPTKHTANLETCYHQSLGSPHSPSLSARAGGSCTAVPRGDSPPKIESKQPAGPGRGRRLKGFQAVR